MKIEPFDVGSSILSITELMRENWEETGYDHEFNPNADAYSKLQSSGYIIAFGAYVDGSMIGYASALISRELHNPEIVSCMSDALFVSKKYRNTSAGGRLILAIEAEARRRGATQIQWGAKPGSTLQRTLAKRNYSASDVMMLKEL